MKVTVQEETESYYPLCFHHFLLPIKLVIIIMAGNTIPATTQMIQLTSQLFVERLNPKYIAVAINQYALEIAVVIDWFFFFSFE